MFLKRLNQYCFCLFIMTFSGISSAVEFGLGVTLESNYGSLSNQGNAILIPVVLSPSFLVEPFYREEEYSMSDSLGVSLSTDMSQLGLGVFYRSPVKDKLDFYAGVRGGYITEKISYASSSEANDTVSYGYSLAPTLGFQYHIAPKLSVSAEADWARRKVDGKRRDPANGNSNPSDESKGTSTRVVLRYLF